MCYWSVRARYRDAFQQPFCDKSHDEALEEPAIGFSRIAFEALYTMGRRQIWLLSGKEHAADVMQDEAHQCRKQVLVFDQMVP